MSDKADSKVCYLGQSSIGQSKIIVPPNKLFDAGLDRDRDTVDWSIDSKTGVIIVSNGKLSHPRYTHVSERVCAGKTESYRFSIPAQFFAETAHSSEQMIQISFPGQGKLKPGESLHFVSADVMSVENGRACFALTDEELNDSFDLGGLLDPWE